jgi:hypothetical protein
MTDDSDLDTDPESFSGGGGHSFYWRGTTLFSRHSHQPVARIEHKGWSVICGDYRLDGLPLELARDHCVKTAEHLLGRHKPPRLRRR